MARVEFTEGECEYLRAILKGELNGALKDLAQLNPKECPGAHELAQRHCTLLDAMLEKLGK